MKCKNCGCELALRWHTCPICGGELDYEEKK